MTATLTSTLPGKIVKMSETLYRRGWLPGTSGNISARDGNHSALITGSGLSKGELTVQDIVPVRISDSARIKAESPRPSAETTIHTAIYRASDSGAVIHVHSPFAAAVSTRYGRPGELSAVPFRNYELLKGFGLTDPFACSVPVFANWTDVARIGRDVETYLTSQVAGPPVLLIAGHGATSWGRDLAQARDRLECLEALCELVIHTGTPQPWVSDTRTTGDVT